MVNLNFMIIGVCFPLSYAFHVICFPSVFYFGYNSASYNSMNIYLYVPRLEILNDNFTIVNKLTVRV